MNEKIAAIAGISLLTAPLAPQDTPPAVQSHTEIPSSSWRASVRQMKAQLASYIQPSQANYIDAPLPSSDSADEMVGIYGNILYPQDWEKMAQMRIGSWLEACAKDPNTAFPLSEIEMRDLSLYILDRIIIKLYRHAFAEEVSALLANGSSLEDALAKARAEGLDRADLYKDMAAHVPPYSDRSKILASKLTECAERATQILDKDIKTIRANPDTAVQTLQMQTTLEQLPAHYAWDLRTEVFRQLVDKVTAIAPHSPYFLALQEVTPQALGDLKKTLASRDLQWISFNNQTGKATLDPGCEETLGEANAFTSTIALSRDLEVLKIDLGDLPTESGSVRKILGVRVRNTHTGEISTIFSTHTDHVTENDLYAKTAAKLHEFAVRFFEDAPETANRYVIGGDLNAFEQLGGANFLEKLRSLFTGSQDFRETDYYAPQPIAWSSFIGRPNDSFAAPIEEDGTIAPNALDHILAGSAIKLQSAAREALVYDESGKLLDYYQDQERYMEHLKKRITFSDHLFNVVRFK